MRVRSNELIHVSKGNFWEKDWSKIAVSGKDPLDIFLSFKKAKEEEMLEALRQFFGENYARVGCFLAVSYITVYEFLLWLVYDI